MILREDVVKALEIFEQEELYGKVTLSFEKGVIVVVHKDETFKSGFDLFSRNPEETRK